MMERYDYRDYTAMNVQNTKNALNDAISENVSDAMKMYSNLNPTQAIDNMVNNVQQPRLGPEIGLIIIIGVGVISSVIGGLLLDWIRGRKRG